MIFYAIVLFSLAVLIGLGLIFIGVRYRRSSPTLSLSHAGVAVTALVLLVVAIFRVPEHHLLYNNAALLFVLTLAGGLVLLALREGRKPPSMIVVGVHAVIATFALYLLFRGYLGG